MFTENEGRQRLNNSPLDFRALAQLIEAARKMQDGEGTFATGNEAAREMQNDEKNETEGEEKAAGEGECA